MANDTTQEWRKILRQLLETGEEVSPVSAGADFRGRTTKERLVYRSVWPLDRAVVTCPGRKPGMRFLAAEPAWIMSGSNRLDEILPFARNLVALSDDGYSMSGAYGPPFIDQIGWVARTLAADPASRQAVMTLWRPRPGPVKDLPCTVALQWFLRPDPATGQMLLYCSATMRSSDAWLGVPYDVHTFSMMSAYLAILLRKLTGLGPRLGHLFLTAGSQHLYKLDWESAMNCVWTVESVTVGKRLRDDELYPNLEPIDIAAFREPHDLIEHLRAVARPPAGHPWAEARACSAYLLETMPHVVGGITA